MTAQSARIDAQSMLAAFGDRFEGRPKLFRAPARINLIGGHTDYNDGFVLPTATGLYTWIAIAPRSDRLLRVFSCRFDAMQDIDLDRIDRNGDGQWYEYVKGVASILESAGHRLHGADLVIDGDIPLGGGLSSSASLESALAYSFLDVAGIEIARTELAKLSQRAETDFVGVRCGIMDQFAICCGAKDHAILLDCRSLEFQRVALPTSARLLVVDTGVHHELPAGEYNARRDECETAVALLAAKIPTLRALRDVDSRSLAEHRALLDDTLYRRCRHITSENQRVVAAFSALRSGDVAELGRLVSASHASLRDDYEVSCAESDALVDLMTSCPGVHGARMVGAGFGGCVIGLVAQSEFEKVMDTVQTKYGAMLGRRPWMHAVTGSDPVGSFPVANGSSHEKMEAQT